METILLSIIAGLILTKHVADISKSDSTQSWWDLWNYAMIFLLSSLLPAIAIYEISSLVIKVLG